MMKDGVHSDAMVSATLTLWDQRCPSSSSCSSITCLVEASTDWSIIRPRHSLSLPPPGRSSTTIRHVLLHNGQFAGLLFINRAFFLTS